MSLILRPPGEAPPLPDRLAELGRARRRAMVAAGTFRLVAVVLFALATAGALDAAVHLPGVVRAFLLVGTLAAAGVVFLRSVRTPAGEPTHPLAVAMMLEDRFPRLNDSLASAVDFLTAGPLSRFRRVAVVRAENMAARYDFDKLVPSGKAWQAFWLALFVTAVAATLVLLDPARTALALTRLADPFGKHPWPTKTTVQIHEPAAFPHRMARGDPFPLKFTVRGVLPEKATVIVRPVGGTPSEDAVALTVAEGEAPTEVTVEHKIDSGRAGKDFEFKVLANDYDSDWLPVSVDPPPRLVPLDGRSSPHVRLTHPAYTDLPPVTLPDGIGVVDAVAGTVVHFRAATDRRIVSAAFHPQADLAPLLSATAAAPLGGDNPFGVVAAQLLADAFTADIPVRVAGPEGTLLEADFIPTVPGLYALRFTDETGLSGTRLFDFRPFPDPAPVVILERPVAGRDSLTLLPTATLPVRARAEDRPYAVRDLFLEYRVGDAPLRTVPLADLVVTGDLLPAVGGFAPARVKPAGLDGERPVPIASLRKPDGTPPADGDTITVRAAAFDWDDRTALKEPGRSKEVEIRVLSRSSLEAQFQKELAAMRPELLRLREQQRGSREKSDEVLKAAQAGPPTAEDAAKLGQAEQAQRQVRNKIADPAEGLRARAEQLRQAVRDNNLSKSPVTEKVELAANELGRLADQHLEAAEPLLNAARQEAGSPTPDSKKVTDLLAKAEKHQKAAEDGLNALLQRLEQWGGAGEVRGEARALKGRLNQADQQADRAAEKVPDEKAPEQLTPGQKAELAAAADKLDQIGEQAGGLVNKATRLATEKENQANALRAAAAGKDKEAAAAAEAEKHPPGSPAAEEAKAAAAALKAEADGMRAAADRAQAEADALRKAVKEAGGQALPEDLKRSADALRRNQPGTSADARRSAAERLDKLTEDLTEKPTESVDELRKKQTAAADDIDKLAEAQDELRKKVDAASKEADPEEREAELQKLAREQEKLRRQAEQTAQRLTRDRQDKPADAVRRAAEQMEAARDELEQGRAPTDKQDEALDRLDEALQKIDQEKKENEEQLSREQREQIAEQLKAIREKQKAHLDEAARLQAAALKAKHWDRPLQASLKDLEDAEKNLAEEVRRFAEKNLAELPVFGKLAEQSASAMDRAGRYLGERLGDILNPEGPFDPVAEKAVGAKIERPMQTALRRLDQILEAVKEDPKKKDKPADQPGGQQPGGDMGGGDMQQGQQGGGIPPLAQLKALRAMQAEVNERTAAFAKAHPPGAELTEEDEDELKELEQAQKDVAELFDKLTPLLKPPAPADPEIP